VYRDELQIFFQRFLAVGDSMECQNAGEVHMDVGGRAKRKEEAMVEWGH
jgi:hypothetical protein